MSVFPSREWVEDYVRLINRSKAYESAAAGWEGDVTLIFGAEPEMGMFEDIYSWLDLWHGKCRKWKYRVPPQEGEKAKFLICARYSRWKQIIRKELDPIQGMMQGKLKLKGDLPTIVRHVKAANELLNIARAVPTQFLDER